MRIVPLIILFICCLQSSAQNVPLGTWTDHLPLKNAMAVAEGHNKIFGAAEYGVVSIDKQDFSIQSITKAKGLSDVMVQNIGFDTATSTLVVAYIDGNIDLLKDGKVTNLPDLKNRPLSVSKTINQIFCHNGTAWLACGFGILRLDLVNREIRDTYFPGEIIAFINTPSVWANDTVIYAATDNGVIRGRLSDDVNLANPANWTRFSPSLGGLPTFPSTAISYFNGEVYAAVGNIIYSYDGVVWTPFYDSGAGWKTMCLFGAPNRLLITQQKFSGNDVTGKRILTASTSGLVTTLGPDNNIERPSVILEDGDGVIWYADLFRGFIRHKDGNGFESYIPNGPYGFTSREMDFLNGTMWVTSSGDLRSWDPNNTPGGSNGFYGCTNYFWDNYNEFSLPELDGIFNIGVAKALTSQNKMLFGTNAYGILEWEPATNTLLQFEKPNPTSSPYRITGADTDVYGDTWMSNAYAGFPLVCRKRNGSYAHLSNSLLNNKLLFDIVADDYGQLWIPVSGSGMVVVDFGGTVDEPSDDRYITYTTVAGAGGLPTNDVTTLANDKDGILWIGTSQGIAVVYCPGSVFDRQCDADRICIPREDNPEFCDILLEDEVVNCIKVDEGNRKWVGTNSGLYLLSEDGLETIRYFNEKNSPLLSNVVRTLAINPVNGDLYISTDKGINIYRSDATVTDENTEKLHVYPNPVRPDYDGPIAIKGLPNNAVVKITDITGTLVFETRAMGGMAVWDGLLSNGKRASSGVYLVMAATDDGGEKAVTKFVMISN